VTKLKYLVGLINTSQDKIWQFYLRGKERNRVILCQNTKGEQKKKLR